MLAPANRWVDVSEAMDFVCVHPVAVFYCADISTHISGWMLRSAPHHVSENVYMDMWTYVCYPVMRP